MEMDVVNNLWQPDLWCMFDHYLFQPVHNADFIVPVEIDGTIHQVT